MQWTLIVVDRSFHSEAPLITNRAIFVPSGADGLSEL